MVYEVSAYCNQGPKTAMSMLVGAVVGPLLTETKICFLFMVVGLPSAHNFTPLCISAYMCMSFCFQAMGCVGFLLGARAGPQRPLGIGRIGQLSEFCGCSLPSCIISCDPLSFFHSTFAFRLWDVRAVCQEQGLGPRGYW